MRRSGRCADWHQRSISCPASVTELWGRHRAAHLLIEKEHIWQRTFASTPWTAYGSTPRQGMLIVIAERSGNDQQQRWIR